MLRKEQIGIGDATLVGPAGSPLVDLREWRLSASSARITVGVAEVDK